MDTIAPTTSPGDREARIKQYLPLVRHTVSGMRGAHFQCGAMDFEDLVGYGTIGLIQAVDRFQPSQGVPFTAFAVARIRGAVLDALRASDPLGRASRRIIRKIENTENELSLELERTPTSEEVQAAAGIPAESYWNARAASTVSNVPLDGTADEETNWSDRIADGAEPVSSAGERVELMRTLSVAIESLPERERLVLSLYYVEGLKVVDIARVLDLSQTRISQLLHRAYGRLRAHQQLSEVMAVA